jgi:hypothetical protein
MWSVLRAAFIVSHCVSGIGIELVRSHGMNRDSSISDETRCRRNRDAFT